MHSCVGFTCFCCHPTRKQVHSPTGIVMYSHPFCRALSSWRYPKLSSGGNLQHLVPHTLLRGSDLSQHVRGESPNRRNGIRAGALTGGPGRGTVTDRMQGLWKVLLGNQGWAEDGSSIGKALSCLHPALGWIPSTTQTKYGSACL